MLGFLYHVYMRFITTVFYSVALGAILISAPSESPRVVEFAPTPPRIAPMPMDVARAYANANNLTCRMPANAELDDTFLTMHVNPTTYQPVSNRIVEVDLDTALDSQGKRLVLLACD